MVTAAASGRRHGHPEGQRSRHPNERRLPFSAILIPPLPCSSRARDRVLLDSRKYRSRTNDPLAPGARPFGAPIPRGTTRRSPGGTSAPATRGPSPVWTAHGLATSRIPSAEHTAMRCALVACTSSIDPSGPSSIPSGTNAIGRQEKSRIGEVVRPTTARWPTHGPSMHATTANRPLGSNATLSSPWATFGATSVTLGAERVMSMLSRSSEDGENGAPGPLGTSRRLPCGLNRGEKGRSISPMPGSIGIREA
jgi:hypothetical protein